MENHAMKINSRMLVCFSQHAGPSGVSKLSASVGVDIQASAGVLAREGVWVDVRLDDAVTSSQVTLAALLGFVLPLQGGTREQVCITEEMQAMRVISLFVPIHANGLNA